MSSNKFFQAAAGTAAASGGAGLNVEEVFSTYLYEGNSSTQTITNGIDLSGEGGLVWIKSRDNTASHFLNDTERGVNKQLISNSTDAEINNTARLQNFNANGFQLGDNAGVNASSISFASWTFRKAPKFFDVVTYTGTGSNQNISHNLGVTPGFVMVKRLSDTGNWSGWHRSLTDADDYILLNSTNGETAGGASYNRTVNDTTYQVFGDYPDEGSSGQTYVAYLWAHNDGDGTFGPDGNQDIIKCGSYTGNGSSDGQFIDLGFEPQWLLVKKSSAADNWILMDNMRGMVTSSSVSNNNDETLRPNTSGAEVPSNDISSINPTGFTIREGGNSLNSTSATYIYIAIRRGPMAVPESATEVFHATTFTGNGTTNRFLPTGFAVDVNFTFGRDGRAPCFGTRLTDAMYESHTTSNSYVNLTNWIDWDYNTGIEYPTAYSYSNSTNTPYVTYNWQRRPNYFDNLVYTGNSTANRSIPHNLDATPEMIWVKCITTARNWSVYHSGLTGSTPAYRSALRLNSDSAELTNETYWSNYPDADNFYIDVNGGDGNVNLSGDVYLAYLFTSLDGISKVGSVDHVNGTRSYVDCGFSNGARFVLFKYVTSSIGLGGDPSNWHIFDTERGILGGTEPRLALNNTAAEITTGNDYIDPDNAGFSLPGGHPTGKYIYYAIA